jgi:hypothetical protein
MFKFRRFVHFEELVIDKYRYGENIFPRDVKFCPRTGYISCGDKILRRGEKYSCRNGTCQ